MSHIKRVGVGRLFGRGEAAAWALLYDGEKQRYGTQIVPGPDGKPQVWPIEDEAQVDTRRAAVGLEPLAVYLRRFGL